MSAPDPRKRDVLISKALSYLLRHGAEKEQLPIDAQGWVPVASVLRNNRIRTHKASAADIERVVADNEKQRFRLRTDGAQTYICASQGHTLRAVVPDLELLTAHTMPAEVYHGTYEHKLAAIRASGLSRMDRNHIHLTSDAAWSRSGIRRSCNALIYIDTGRCMADGLQFWKSANGVILCSGDADGVIAPQYFQRIVSRQCSGEARNTSGEQCNSSSEQ